MATFYIVRLLKEALTDTMKNQSEILQKQNSLT